MTSPVEENLSDIPSLHWVVKSSDWTFEEIKEHLERGFYYTEELDNQGRTPLFSLVEKPNCSASVVEVLIQNGAKVDRVDKFGRTSLILALENEKCSADVVMILLYYGADVNHRCVMGVSPLITALQHTRDKAIIQLLLQEKAQLQICPSDLFPLCVALRCDASKEVIELLLQYGCDLNGCNRHNSALYCATSFPNPGLREDVLQVLLDAGADVESTNLEGQPLMCYALQKGADVSMIKTLMRAGVTLDACPYHTTPLLCATSLYNEFLEMAKVRRLCKKPKRYGGIPLKAEVVQFLLEHECDSWSEEGMKPVFCALRYCDYETKAIELLLKRASRRKMSTRRRLFCKHLLSQTIFNFNVTPAVVKLLVKWKKIKACTRLKRSRDTLLHRALQDDRCQPEMIKALLEVGCSVLVLNDSTGTALQTAILYKRNSTILNLLLTWGSRVGGRASMRPPLLNLALKQYDDQNTTDQLKVLKRRECLKTLFRFVFLEYPDFDIGYFVSRGLISKVLLGSIKTCLAEVRGMEKEVFGFNTLFDIVSQRGKRFEIHELDQVLDILLKNHFPIYMDLIGSKISRKLLINKFQDLPVYIVRSYNGLEKEYLLNFECISKITGFLSTPDILSFVLAYCSLSDRDNEH